MLRLGKSDFSEDFDISGLVFLNQAVFITVPNYNP